MSNSSTRTTDGSGSRRTARDASMGQGLSSPSSIRKSQRLEKRTASTPPMTRKSERLVKQNTPSPLRRSNRGKKHNLSSPLVPKRSVKRSSSLDAKKKKEKKEKSIKQLTMESGQVILSEKQDQESVSLKRKRMDARSYKALFKTQRRRVSVPDSSEKLGKPDAMTQTDSIECGDNNSKLLGDSDADHQCDHKVVEVSEEEALNGASECITVVTISGLKCADANVSRNNIEAELSYSHRECRSSEKPPNHLDGDDASMIACTHEEILDDVTKGQKESSGNHPGSENIDHCVQLKSNTSSIDLHSNVTAAEIGKNATAAAEAVASTSVVLANCVACSKRRRLDYYSPEQELCSCTASLNRSPFDNLCNKDIEAAVNPDSVENWDGIAQLKGTSLYVQSDICDNVCVLCKQGGKLICCDGKGCRRCYHLSCLDPPLDTIPPGVWHCSYCVKKKINFGIYTVSKGVESIWDVREVVVSDAKEMRRQRQYLVKYQGLAHFYNHWVPESQLLHEAPSLLVNFTEKHLDVKWNPKWMVPCRLLSKRLLMNSAFQDKDHCMSTDAIADCQCEWLVKWCGLNYEHATWELWNADPLCSFQGQRLVKEYEIRHEKAKRLTYKRSMKSFVKLRKLPAEGSTVCYNSVLNNVNKMRELWYKNQNAVILDEQDRLVNVIFFILSLSDDHRPFLITSTSDTLPLWESEFQRLAPSVNVVVYDGNKDILKSIRTLEFYEEGGGMMLEVLLSPMEVVIEDLDSLKQLKWEAIIIDECQRCRASLNLEQMKMLDTDMRVLIFNGRIKDMESEYLTLLSMLDSPGDLDKAGGLKSDPNNNLVNLKESFARFIAYGNKLESLKFVEYWVPVELSNLQLEQYCATLLNNSISLRSCSKTDHVGAIRETLMTIRKCCDHPYLVDPSLQTLIIRGLPAVEILDVGIKASGKLQLLDRIISESKSQQLRVLVLFQSIIGSGGVLVGDILDDFLRLRFGPSSYERVDACVAISKKQGALNRFNKEGSEQFVFLLENRSCHSSIKLSAVDIIVIFDSEWNPANDLKALQRISIDSRNDHINVFRLYSSCTIEEKVLILGKKNLNLDNNLQNISRSMSDSLLRWRASCLFSRLDEFHSGNRTTSAADVSSGQSLLDDVVKNFLAVLSDNYKNSDDNDFVISKVFRNVGFYQTNCPLLGERKIQMTDTLEPQVFWKNLLDGRNPHWKFLDGHGPPSRNRKRALYHGTSPRKFVTENQDPGNKNRKVGNVDAASVQLDLEEGQVAGSKGEASVAESDSLTVSVARGSDDLSVNIATNCLSHESSFRHQSGMTYPDATSPSREQKSLHVFLKSEMEKLCDVLSVSKDVEHMVGRLLEYVMENYHVNKEPTSILQAFQMSLCWIAASILKEKIDRKDSLLLVKQSLNFQCTEEEANYVYAKLRLLKKTFLQLPGNISYSNSSNNFVSAREDRTVQPSNAGDLSSVFVKSQNVKGKIEERSTNLEFLDGKAPNNKAAENNMEKIIRKIQKKCDKRMSKLHLKHDKELQEFHKKWEGKRVKLDEEHKLELALIRTIHGNSSMGMDKLKISDNEFAEKMGEQECLKEVQLKELEAKHLAEMEEERKKSAKRLADAKSCISQYKVDDMHIRGSESEDERGFSMTSGPVTYKGPNKDGFLPGQHVKEKTLSNTVQPTQPSHAIFSDVPESVTDGSDGGCVSAETLLLPASSSSEKVLDTVRGDTPSFVAVEEPKEVNHFSQPSTEHIADEIPSTDQNNEIPSGVLDNAGSEINHAHTAETSGAIGSDKGKDRGKTVISNVMGNQKVSLDSSSSKGIPPVELPSIDLGVSLPQDCVLQVECLNNKESLDLQDENEQVTEKQGTVVECENSQGSLDLQDENEHVREKQGTVVECANNKESFDLHDENVQVTEKQGTVVGVAHSTTIEDGHSLQSHCEAHVIENCDKLQPASDDLAPNRSQPSAAEAIYEGCSGGSNSLQNSVTPPQLVEEPVELPERAVSHDVDNMVLHPSSNGLESSSNHNTPDLQASNRTDYEPNSEPCEPLESSVVPSNVLENAAELPNQAVLQQGHNLAVVEGSPSHLPVQHAPLVGSWNATLPLQTQPLHGELERIRKEIEEAIKVHDNTKLLLKSACEKEIEEIVTQIRDKYETKLKDAEAAFSLKKTELDSNHKQVLMNKMLAEAFRSKCLDVRPSGISGMQQVVPSGFMQHLYQLSLPSTMRHSPLANFSSASQPATSHQIVNPSLQSTQRSLGNLSSIAARPPQIGAITPTVGIARVGGDIRAPAPHLQAVRPPVSLPSTNLSSLPPGNIPNQLVVETPALFPLQPQEPLSMTNNFFHQQNPPFVHQSPSPLPTLSINHSSSSNRLSGTESGVYPGPHNSSLSALQLLRDVHGKNNGELPGLLPHLTDFGFSSKNDALNLSDNQTIASPQCIETSALACDVVCLSDDDD